MISKWGEKEGGERGGLGYGHRREKGGAPPSVKFFVKGFALTMDLTEGGALIKFNWWVARGARARSARAARASFNGWVARGARAR